METNYKQRYDTLTSVLTDTTWPANARMVCSAALIKAFERDPEGQCIHFDDLTINELIYLTGYSKPVICDILQAFESIGFIKRDKSHPVVNRYGTPIERADMTPEHGDHYMTQTDTTLFLDQIPANIPLWPESKRQARDKERAKQYRGKVEKLTKELADVTEKLRVIACPICGAKGYWHLKCGACQAEWDAQTGDMIKQGVYDMPDNVLIDAVTPEVKTLNPRPEVNSLNLSITGKESLLAESSTEGGDSGAAYPTSATEPLEPAHNPLSSTGDARSGADRPPLSASTALDQAESLEVEPLDFIPEVLSGAEAVEFLADLGAQFCAVEPRSKRARNPRDDWGGELNYLDAPLSGDAAKLCLARQDNVGMLGGRGNLALLDVDSEFGDLITRYDKVVMLPRIVRDNARDRAKLLIVLAEGNVHTREWKGDKRKLELLALGNMGVVAGTHESGAEIRLLTGKLEVFTLAQLEAMARQWTGTTNQVTPTVRAALAARPQGSLLRDAIAWWNCDRSNQARVDELLRHCKRSGKYVSIRPDDGSPSTLASTDPYSERVKRTYRDFGSKQTYDDFELYCLLANEDKRTYKWQIVEQYKQETAHLRH